MDFSKFFSFFNFFGKKAVETEPVEVEPERPAKSVSGHKALWYPKAVIEPEGIKMITRGTYRKGYPEGAVVHFTCGWSQSEKLTPLQHGINSAKYARKSGYSYFLITADGQVIQCHPLDKHAWHAGPSYWPNLGDTVSSKCVGIEVMNWGSLDERGGKYYCEGGHALSPSEIRHVRIKKDNQQPGAYHKYTEAQEKALIELLLWLKKNNPEIFSFENVVGHDEIAPKRKNDPGGSLSMTMPELRKLLKSKT